MAQHRPGDRTGKLLGDPSVWYPVNAQIDGIDPFSSSPHESLKYAVYRRRSLIAAMETKALLLSAINPEKAPEVAARYFELVLPIGEDTKAMEEMKKEKQMQAIQKMGVIPASSIKVGKAIGDPVGPSAPLGSMHSPRKHPRREGP